VSPDLVIPLLFTTLPVVHHPSRFSRDRAERLRRNQEAVEYFTKVWGGLPGFTPRDEPEQQALELAITQYAHAVESHPDMQRLGLRGR
jgi:hypothetical protein